MTAPDEPDDPTADAISEATDVGDAAGVGGDRPSGDAPRTRSGRPVNQVVGRGPTWKGARSAALTFVLGSIGAVIALWLLGPVRIAAGPVTIGLSVSPAISGKTVLNLAPLGAFEIDSHDAPVKLEAEVADLDPKVAGAYITQGTPPKFDIGDTLPRALAGGALTFIGVAALGGGLLTGVARRSWRLGLAGAAIPFVALGGCLGVAAITFDPDKLVEPRVDGALALIPDAADRVGTYLGDRDAFSDNVGNTTSNAADLYLGLYGAGAEHPDTVRILHISDLHLNAAALRMAGRLATTFNVDVVANTGDDADWGSPVESEILGGPEGLDVPYLWVRGNHDTMDTQQANAQQGAVVLDGTETTVDGLTFFGVGDPTFSPDLDKAVIKEGQTKFKAQWSKSTLLPTYEAQPVPPDVTMTHDPAMASAIEPHPRLRLAGHTHAMKVSAGHNPDGTLWALVVNGSTGGAGLRVLDHENENPMAASIITVDKDTKEPMYVDVFTYRPLVDQTFQVERIDFKQLARTSKGE